jgi:hypothetical protein
MFSVSVPSTTSRQLAGLSADLEARYKAEREEREKYIGSLEAKFDLWEETLDGERQKRVEVEKRVRNLALRKIDSRGGEEGDGFKI